MYLGGFVLECLLKAKLLEKHRWLQRPSSVRARRWSPGERRLYDLCYRRHDPVGLLEALPEVVSRLETVNGYRRVPLSRTLKQICAQWTVHIRYSPRMARMREADEFLRSIAEVRRWLA